MPITWSVFFLSVEDQRGHTWPPHSAPGRGDARVNDAGPAHASESPCKRAYAVQISLLIKAEMSTCSLKHLVLSFCCYHSEAVVAGGDTITHAHMCVFSDFSGFI